jgi:hypothetical protein
MNISAYGHKFFIFAGILLIAIAAVQGLSRRRESSASGRFHFDATTVQAVIFVTVGLLAVLAGIGVLPMPGDR